MGNMDRLSVRWDCVWSWSLKRSINYQQATAAVEVFTCHRAVQLFVFVNKKGLGFPSPAELHIGHRTSNAKNNQEDEHKEHRLPGSRFSKVSFAVPPIIILPIIFPSLKDHSSSS